MRAAHFGLLEVALLLLDYGADADARTVTGPFPDFTARYSGCFDRQWVFFAEKYIQ